MQENWSGVKNGSSRRRRDRGGRSSGSVKKAREMSRGLAAKGGRETAVRPRNQGRSAMKNPDKQGISWARSP